MLGTVRTVWRRSEHYRSGCPVRLALVSAVVIGGCDLVPSDPAADSRTPHRGSSQYRTTPSSTHPTTLKVGAEPELGLRAVANVSLGALKRKSNRIILKSLCTRGTQSYIDLGKLLLPSFTHPSGKTVTIDELPFSGKAWDDEITQGDCDIWVSLRERIQKGQYEETLLASRCQRDGVWGEQSCSPLPTLGAPKPATAGSFDVRVHFFEFRDSRKGGHRLALYVEYGVKHPVGWDWGLEAETLCSAGSESVAYTNGLNGVDPVELRPGEKTIGFMPAPYKVEQMLSVPQERCEVTIRAERSRGEVTHDIATFCLEVGKDARAGACLPA